MIGMDRACTLGRDFPQCTCPVPAKSTRDLQATVTQHNEWSSQSIWPGLQAGPEEDCVLVLYMDQEIIHEWSG